MTANLQNVLRYWRASLADSTLGKGTFNAGDLRRFMTVSGDVIRTGKLPREETGKLFARCRKTQQHTQIRFRPFVAVRKHSRGMVYDAGRPEIITPVVTAAQAGRDGTLTPLRTMLARDILAPLPRETFSVACVDALDAFLDRTPAPDMVSGASWKAYTDYCRKMLDTVAGGWPHGDGGYVLRDIALVEAAGDGMAMIRSITGLYDSLLVKRPDTPLLRRVALPEKTKRPGTGCSRQMERSFMRRPGHANPDFPLSEHQRKVLAYLDGSSRGDVLAVNGPPGTGKTTMLLSAIAGLWIRAALDGTDPPVVVASSANNQAVSNIIDAFGKVSPGDGPFAGRWLPGVDSFGIFLVSKSGRAKAALKYQTEDFQKKCETGEYFTRARKAYLEAGRNAFPRLENPCTEDIVRALHGEMIREAEKLAGLDFALERLEKTGGTPGVDKHAERIALDAALSGTVAEKRDDARRLESVKTALKAHLSRESFFVKLFSFLPAAGKKRTLSAWHAVRMSGFSGTGCSGKPDSVADIARRIEKEYGTAVQAHEHACLEREKVRKMHRLAEQAEECWRRAAAHFGGSAGLAEMEEHADTGVRFRLFLLATHYWEGRWLMEMEAGYKDIAASWGKREKAILVSRWKRRMMLTPCAVATFASLPGYLQFVRKNGAAWETDYLYDFIDLLIVDEAGQVLPETAAASFSLAGRALVIGDTQQLEPISSIPAAVDAGNLKACGLVCDDEGGAFALPAGLCSTTGSVMQMAQDACTVSPGDGPQRGLYLLDHRRCHDEIIAYCNALCYKGILRPRRGCAPQDAPLPALGYLHVDGCAVSAGGSYLNVPEAETVAAWLEMVRPELEAYYRGMKLEEIVGVLTPFGRQVQAVRKACAARNIIVQGEKGMTVGTVHSLQGAERPVIVFSPVYSRHADGGFIDRSPGMLNVAVSRARDSCLFFGDMEVLSAAGDGTPRGILAGFLFGKNTPAKELEFSGMPPRKDLTGMNADGLQTLSGAAEHDAFLLEALAGPGKSYAIVSPWIFPPNADKAGILPAFEAATRRGAQIDLYVDPVLNGEKTCNGSTWMELAEKAFSKSSVRLHKVSRLHSKLVTVDDTLISVGSYNWLSAARKGPNMRHETTFVYRGQHVKEEVRIQLDKLKKHAAGKERPGLSSR